MLHTLHFISRACRCNYKNRATHTLVPVRQSTRVRTITPQRSAQAQAPATSLDSVGISQDDLLSLLSASPGLAPWAEEAPDAAQAHVQEVVQLLLTLQPSPQRVKVVMMNHPELLTVPALSGWVNFLLAYGVCTGCASGQCMHPALLLSCTPCHCATAFVALPKAGLPSAALPNTSCATKAARHIGMPP